MEEKKLWELIGKKVTGEADAGELAELNRLLERFPEALYTLETMENYWKSSPERADRELREASLDRHLQRLHEGMSKEREEASGREEAKERETGMMPDLRRPAVIKYLLAATAIAAACAGVVFLWPALRRGTTGPAIAATAKITVTTGGQRRRLDLPDGSIIWLNAGTTVSYSESYARDSSRELDLDGEAFFKVKHDAGHPFVVHTRHTDVLDIGTSFNIKAYAPDKTVEATLLEGAIEVRGSRGGKKILLTRPNQKCTVFTGPEAVRPAEPSGLPGPSGHAGLPPNGGALSDSANGTDERYQVSTVRPDPADSLLAETAWLHDALVFRNESFEDLSIRMGRRYMVSIRFASPEQANYRFTGVVTHETLEQALQELQLMRPFHYTKSKSIITITR